MADGKKRYLPNKEEIASKIMDGEAVIINLKTGIYYNSEQVGGLIWEMVEAGQSLEEITQGVLAAYDVEAGRLVTDLQKFIEELLSEDLITEAPAGFTSEGTIPSAAGFKAAYQPPILNIYRDMAELMALDPPIPGVEDTPWKAD